MICSDIVQMNYLQGIAKSGILICMDVFTKPVCIIVSIFNCINKERKTIKFILNLIYLEII